MGWETRRRGGAVALVSNDPKGLSVKRGRAAGAVCFPGGWLVLTASQDLGLERGFFGRIDLGRLCSYDHFH